MNKAQRDRIIEVIKNGAEIASRYSDASGRTCAIGGLAKAASIPFPGYRSPGNRKGVLVLEYQRGAKRWGQLANRLYKEYGLTHDQQADIQRLNDGHYHQDERRAAIIEYIMSLPVED